MLAVLNVGEDEKHVVEVERSYWSGLRIVRVDGKEIDRQRSFRPWSRFAFRVGDREEHRVELAFNLLSARASVDGMLFRRSLFPQDVVYNVFLLLGVFLIVAVAGVMLFRPKIEMQRAFEALQHDDYDQAIYHYDEAIRLGQDNATAYNNRGWARYGKKQYDEALADFTRAIELKCTLGRGVPGPRSGLL